MKKFLVIVLAIIILLTSFSPVLAHVNKPSPQPFNIPQNWYHQPNYHTYPGMPQAYPRYFNFYRPYRYHPESRNNSNEILAIIGLLSIISNNQSNSQIDRMQLEIDRLKQMNKMLIEMNENLMKEFQQSQQFKYEYNQEELDP